MIVQVETDSGSIPDEITDQSSETPQEAEITLVELSFTRGISAYFHQRISDDKDDAYAEIPGCFGVFVGNKRQFVTAAHCFDQMIFNEKTGGWEVDLLTTNSDSFSAFCRRNPAWPSEPIGLDCESAQQGDWAVCHIDMANADSLTHSAIDFATSNDIQEEVELSLIYFEGTKRPLGEITPEPSLELCMEIPHKMHECKGRSGTPAIIETAAGAKLLAVVSGIPVNKDSCSLSSVLHSDFEALLGP